MHPRPPAERLRKASVNHLDSSEEEGNLLSIGIRVGGFINVNNPRSLVPKLCNPRVHRRTVEAPVPVSSVRGLSGHFG
jgi:hypothetical protein